MVAAGRHGSKSGALEVVFMDCQVVCLAGCCVGENGLADVTFGVRAFSDTMVGAAVGTRVGILGC
jgi:hypothetical protein